MKDGNRYWAKAFGEGQEITSSGSRDVVPINSITTTQWPTQT
jgi:hypothetical protein